MARAAQLRGVAQVQLGVGADNAGETAARPDDDVVLLLERGKDSKSAALRAEYLQKCAAGMPSVCRCCRRLLLARICACTACFLQALHTVCAQQRHVFMLQAGCLCPAQPACPFLTRWRNLAQWFDDGMVLVMGS
jgi:hypothetical protein